MDGRVIVGFPHGINEKQVVCVGGSRIKLRIFDFLSFGGKWLILRRFCVWWFGFLRTFCAGFVFCCLVG
jgi:hypothetical protein